MIYSYLKNLKKNKVIFIIFSVIFIALSVIHIFYSEGYADLIKSLDPSEIHFIPISIYYYVQSSMTSIQLTLLLFIASSNIFAVDKLIDKQSHFSILTKLRVNPNKYYKNMLLINSVYSFVYYLIIQITIIFTLFILIGTFDFSQLEQNDIQTHYNLFSNSYQNSFFIYLIFSSLGFVIYSDFIYSLSTWIKNIYVYRGSGLIIGILLTALPAIICGSIFNLTNSDLFLYIGSLFFLPNLINPGLQPFVNHTIFQSPYLTYLTTLLFYCIMLLILSLLSKRKERNCE